MTRVVFHAGFPKSASSSIQGAIGNNTVLLARRGIVMLSHDLSLRDDGRFGGFPIWLLEEENKTAPAGRTLTDRVLAAAQQLRTRGQGDGTILISSENLSQPGMARLFAGLDDAVDVSVVFYMRAQADWIASAWKQWGLQDGHSLEAYVQGCLESRMPDNRLSLDSWAQALPKARIIVRPLFRELLREGSVVRDFLEIIGASDVRLAETLENPSFDYSLLHVVSKNVPRLFQDKYDTFVLERLVEILPEAYLQTGIDMLSTSVTRSIEAAYKDDNLYILETYCGYSVEQSAAIHERHFVRQPGAPSYLESDEADVIGRAAKILFEVHPDRQKVYALLGELIKDVTGDPKSRLTRLRWNAARNIRSLLGRPPK